MASPISDHRIVSAGALALALLLSAPARAADAKEQVRANLVAGVELLERGDAAGALVRFQEAYRLIPSPKILYDFGLAYAALDRKVDALEAFQRFLGEAPDAPADARKNAEAQVLRLRGEVGSLRVTSSAKGAAVFVDQRPFGHTPDHAPILLAPGKHLVEVRPSAGGAPVSVPIEIAANELRTISLEVAKVPATAPAGPPPATQPVPAGTESAPWLHPWQRGVGYGAAVAGAGALIAGGVLAVVGASQASSAESRLAKAMSPAQYDQERPAYDAGKQRNRTGWILAGVGAGVLAGGVLLIATAPEGNPKLALTPWLAARSWGASVSSTW